MQLKLLIYCDTNLYGDAKESNFVIQNAIFIKNGNVEHKF